MSDDVKTRTGAGNTPQSGFCQVNGNSRTVRPGPATLLEWLREEVGCMDVPRACETGHCGSCVVLADQLPVKSCSLLACEIEGRQIFTLEGLRMSGRVSFSAVARAIEIRQPFQCGYCKPAFVMAAMDLLERNAMPTEAQIREAFAGLLCRCTGYQSIVESVLLSATFMSAPEGPGGETR